MLALGKMKINSRIFWLIFICLLLSSAAIFQTSRIAVQKNIEDSMYNYVRLNQEKAGANVESVIDQVNMLSVRLQTNSEIYNLLEDARPEGEKQAKLIDLLNDMMIDRTIVGDIVILTHHGSAYNYNRQQPADMPGRSYLNEIEHSNTPVWGGVKKDADGNSHILLGRRYQNFFTGQNLGCLVVYIKERAIHNILKDVIVPDRGYSFLTADDSYILSYPAPERAGATIFDNDVFMAGSELSFKKISLAGKPAIVTRYPLRGNLAKLGSNWSIVSVVSDEKLLENVNKINTYAAFIQIALLLVAILISYYVSKRIILPIRRLNGKINQFNGDATVVPFRKSKDELWVLENSFNEMVVRIRELIERQNEEKDRQREMELVALQAQINPHFLYNTLDAIGWMAKIHKQKNIEEIVVALSHFYRLGLHKGDKYITVEEELGIARSYIAIETMRTPGKFEVEYDISGEILHFMMLKMLLQPLIENAIKHGIRGKRGKGRLVIKGYRSGDEIRFEITDDGAGFAVGELEKADAAPRYNGGGYGIRNVNERIRLEYGAEYGVTIISAIGRGTTSIVTVRPK
ncbi:cache domain-containing sensor histidine kinase [Paenibacillus hamazuiensis]|uniref:cache domain-containing sensor histidine kinase n=1 Tax=Paenibacillus hamazuiensis TaxID=2936508 RepID=UPI00200E5D44|nr:sensor histidine kinase [Paenibacillus hamazuiensis]